MKRDTRIPGGRVLRDPPETIPDEVPARADTCLDAAKDRIIDAHSFLQLGKYSLEQLNQLYAQTSLALEELNALRRSIEEKSDASKPVRREE